MDHATDISYCQSDQLAAYLDGELSAADSVVIDEHLRQCAKCRGELADQRSLLRTIDSTFRPAENLPLPIDFARLVAARAESDMSGVRDRREHRLAFRLCAGLALLAFAIMGFASSSVIFNFGRRAFNLVTGVFDLGWTIVYDAGAGLMIVSRMLGKGFIPGSLFTGLVTFLLLGLAFLVLSRLIAHYHRTRLID